VYGGLLGDVEAIDDAAEEAAAAYLKGRTLADEIAALAALTVDECKALGKLAHQLEMEVLLEIHTEKELDYLHEHVDLIGVNNRNLGTFHTDVENSFRLARKLPKELLWVSESGISQPDTFRQLREAGFRGFLMGETFMKTPSPEKALSDFLQSVAL
jgi:indole-3-glycerol phosphate synthase